jgi:hypothetical protein
MFIVILAREISGMLSMSINSSGKEYGDFVLDPGSESSISKERSKFL